MRKPGCGALDIIRIGATDALVVIDMQKDFGEKDGALYVKGVPGELSMPEVTHHCCELVEQSFGDKTGSLDVHQPGHIEETIFGPHVQEGKPGAEPLPELKEFYDRRYFEILVKGLQKAVISHSVSTSPGWASHLSLLRRKGIKRIFLCGLAYTHCVGDSAIAYAQQGFEVYIVRDATRSVAPPYGDPELMKKKLALFGVTEIVADDLGVD